MAKKYQDLKLVQYQEEALNTNHHFCNNLNANSKKKSSLRSLIMLIVFLLTIMGIYSYQKQRKKAFLQQKKTLKRLIIYKKDGQGIILPYARPTVIKAPFLKQSEEVEKVYYQQNRQFLDYIRFLGEYQQFSIKLFNNGWFESDSNIFKAEYYKLNKTYALDHYEYQKGVCVVGWLAHNVNNITADLLNYFLLSINEQNYSNYRVYLVDDTNQKLGLKNNLLNIILKQAEKYPKLSNRLWILKNNNKIGKLGSRDLVIRNYCQPKQIIIDISPFDSLVGKQLFNILNRVYSQNQSTWFVLANYNKRTEQKTSQVKADKLNYLSQIQPGTNIANLKQIILNGSQYRASDVEVNGYFKTYLRQIYMRIPMTHLLQRLKIRYHQGAGDYFVTYSIAELHLET